MVTITKKPSSVIFLKNCTADSSAVWRSHALSGCPASRGETVEEACMVHGIDTDELLERTEQADRSRRCTVNWFYEIAPV
ncbi:MAG: DUF1858 domain-containing protein [Ruminococcus callidus]